MSKYNIEFSKDARNDLINIKNHIKYNLKEPNIARKLNKKIKEKIYKLADYPQLFEIIDDDFIRKMEIGKTLVDNYIIFYKVNENDKNVYIVRIMYGRRNWINIL